MATSLECDASALQRRGLEDSLVRDEKEKGNYPKRERKQICERSALAPGDSLSMTANPWRLMRGGPSSPGAKIPVPIHFLSTVRPWADVHVALSDGMHSECRWRVGGEETLWMRKQRWMFHDQDGGGT